MAMSTSTAFPTIERDSYTAERVRTRSARTLPARRDLQLDCSVAWLTVPPRHDRCRVHEDDANNAAWSKWIHRLEVLEGKSTCDLAVMSPGSVSV
jgi:hypothetical protein